MGKQTLELRKLRKFRIHDAHLEARQCVARVKRRGRCEEAPHGLAIAEVRLRIQGGLGEIRTVDDKREAWRT
ncbi:MAG: hypothetical protein RIR33_2406 [Pseudomonadota bacterium]|jgi:hypothetical protein